jgi:hypothetical protein
MEALLLDTEALLLDTDQTSSRAARKATRESSSMRTINTTMRELSGSFARSAPIAFFCECGNPSCFSVIWMTADGFDTTIAGHRGWMLLETHEPSALWPTRALRPSPETSQTPRAVADAGHGPPRASRKQRRTGLQPRLARAS